MTVFTLPYQVWWSNGAQRTWGMGMNYADPSSRAYGPPTGNNGAVQYYLSPVIVESLVLSATQFQHGISTMELNNLAGQSAKATFFADTGRYGNGSKLMEAPLCLGMGFVSMEYHRLNPMYDSYLFQWICLSFFGIDSVLGSHQRSHLRA